MKNLKLKGALIILSLSLLLSACSVYKSVDIGGVDKVDFKGMVDNKISLQLKVPIKNPNAYKLKITDMDLDVTINGKYLGKMKTSSDIIIPKKSDEVQIFPVDVHVKNMLGTMSMFYKLRKMKNVEMQIVGTMKVKALMRSKTIDISEKQTISL
ncbi:MAG: LEA type 2 family protein [Bacteroidales bacterium]|nr:LEA type 2 family protein [Bacteroidales bacterium]